MLSLQGDPSFDSLSVVIGREFAPFTVVVNSELARGGR